jgi:hypothetical protein
MNSVYLVMAALMPHAMDLGRVSKNPIGFVAQYSAVLPAGLPQFIDDRHIFICRIIATVMVGLNGQPHSARRAVEIAGHDIPADAAAGQVVQRRHTPSEQIGRFIGQIGGDAETDVLGHRRHDRHDHHRVIDRDLHGLDDRRRRAAPVDIVDADDVGQEDPVELAAFRQPRQILPVFDRVVRGRAIARMRPHSVLNMADAVHVEGVEADLFRHRAAFWAGSVFASVAA